MSTVSVAFSLFTLPPPPRSTLFPYTTLFRSKDPGAALSRPFDIREYTATAGELRDLAREGTGVVEGTRSLDRKSTRLNSSHRCISYAVFCLKKKKNLCQALLVCLLI